MKCCGWGYVLRPPGDEPEEPGRSQGEVHIFKIYIIDSKRFQVDRLKTLGRVHYTKHSIYLWNAEGGICSKTPRGRTGRARSVKRGGAHLQYIYNQFQKVSGRLVENPRTSSLHNILRTSDGRTDGRRTDGRMDGRTDTTSNSKLSIIPKVVLIPIDTISGENRKCTHGQGKSYMALWL